MKRILHWLDSYAEESLLSVMLVSIVLLLAMAVFRRYVLRNTSQYTEASATYLFIWIVFLGIPYGIKRKKHIVLDVLPENLPARVNFVLNLIAKTLFGLFLIAFMYFSISTIEQVKAAGMTDRWMQQPLWYFMLCIPIGGGTGLIRIIQDIYLTVVEYRKRGTENE